MAKSTIKTVADLKLWPDNPRKMEPDTKKKLGESLEGWADLGGIVYNRELKCLVGGHQRRDQLPSDAPVIIEQEFDPPLRCGTVAVGYIRVNGERFAYREVDWPHPDHARANIAANKLHGEFVFPELADIAAGLEGVGVSMKKAGYDSVEVERLLSWTPDLETPGLRDPAPSLGTYLTNTVKQITLFFGNEEYGEVLDKFDRIAGANALPNNTAVVSFLLEHYEECVGLDG